MTTSRRSLVSRFSVRRCAWLLPLMAGLASCRLLGPRTAPVPEEQAAGPSAADLERQQQLAALLEKIEALERRLGAPRTPGTAEDTAPGQVLPGPSVARATGVERTDAGTGANASASLGQAPASPAAHPEPPQAITLAALIEALEARRAANPRDLTVERHLRVLYLLAGRDEDALQLIEGAPATEQAFWRQVLWALVNYTDETHGLNEAERAAEAIRALDEARRLLAKEAPLEIRSLTFCNEIRGFGNLIPVAKAEFGPGQLVLLYCELEGFTAVQEGEQGDYRTVVSQRLELLTPRGDSVWTREFPQVEDRCRSPRRDFYFYSKFNLPERVLPGEYVLTVTMTDCLAGKTAEETLSLRIQ